MGVRIIIGREQGGPEDSVAVLYDSVTGVPLPIEVFTDEEDAEGLTDVFLQIATARFGGDIRGVDPDRLREFQADFFKSLDRGEQ